MRIVLSNVSGLPIYEQIAGQIRASILAGEVMEGDKLPSIRGLAKDLRVSVITTTRAYSDLAAEGFIVNVQGKGSYVLARDADLAREYTLGEVERHLGAAIDAARAGGLGPADVRASLDALLATDDTDNAAGVDDAEDADGMAGADDADCMADADEEIDNGQGDNR